MRKSWCVVKPRHCAQGLSGVAQKRCVGARVVESGGEQQAYGGRLVVVGAGGVVFVVVVVEARSGLVQGSWAKRAWWYASNSGKARRPWRRAVGVQFSKQASRHEKLMSKARHTAHSTQLSTAQHSTAYSTAEHGTARHGAGTRQAGRQAGRKERRQAGRQVGRQKAQKEQKQALASRNARLGWAAQWVGLRCLARTRASWIRTRTSRQVRCCQLTGLGSYYTSWAAPSQFQVVTDYRMYVVLSPPLTSRSYILAKGKPEARCGE